jgi:hypothetical protein
VKVWDWVSGRLISSEQIGGVLEGGEMDAVTKVTCRAGSGSSMIVAALERLVYETE